MYVCILTQFLLQAFACQLLYAVIISHPLYAYSTVYTISLLYFWYPVCVCVLCICIHVWCLKGLGELHPWVDPHPASAGRPGEVILLFLRLHCRPQILLLSRPFTHWYALLFTERSNWSYWRFSRLCPYNASGLTLLRGSWPILHSASCFYLRESDGYPLYVESLNPIVLNSKAIVVSLKNIWHGSALSFLSNLRLSLFSGSWDRK